MAQRQRLTNNSDETVISELISGDNIFTIPYFQRAYKWKPTHLRQLNADILNLVDESVDIHFLGAIIIHGRRGNPADPKIFDVIDGQQRLTTLFLYLAAIIKTLTNIDEHGEAAALFLKYLVISRETTNTSNFKLQSCKEDRAQLNQVYLDVMDNTEFREKLGGFKLRQLPKTGSLWRNYQSALRFMNEGYSQGSLERIRAIYEALLDQISVVQIDVWDPTNGPKIFDSLNSRQEPMTIGDLIRNEVFSRVASEDVDVIERVDAEFWQPFYKRFDQDGRNLFDAYFFPYGLVRNPNLKKSEVFSYLREQWNQYQDPQNIIVELSTYQDAFIDIQTGTNLSEHPEELYYAFFRLYSTKLPSSTFPFLMQLSKTASEERVSMKDAIEILEVLESFLVKRAVCGHEPTGLHSVFKRLWADCANEITAERVTREISKHPTVAWPGSEDFKHAIQNRDLYGVGITPFVILEFDRSLGGDSPSNVPWIEHVLPQKPDKKWFKVFSKDDHVELVDRLANLLPLSSEMNQTLSNKPYNIKRKRFREDSMFKSTRQFAEQYATWTPDDLRDRGIILANWAAERWPHGAIW